MNTPHKAAASPPVPLTSVAVGQRVRVADIDSAQDLRARLSAMGLTPGMTVEVVAIGDGPVILSVLGSRLVLGHGMAGKVLVRATPPHPTPN